MKTFNNDNWHWLLSSLQHFHSVVGIAFPMDASKTENGKTQTFTTAQEGSRVFIPTKLFSECEKIALAVQEAIADLDSGTFKNQLQSLWAEFTSLLGRIKKAGRHGEPGAINEAFVLLFLVSGILQHYICSKLEIEVPSTEKFSKVESLEKLVEITGYSELKNLPMEKFLPDLVMKIKSLLR